MNYLKEFEELINQRDNVRFVRLWEEYCQSECIDDKELIKILEKIKSSEFACFFGSYAESTLLLSSLLGEDKAEFDILRLILDLQTTNSVKLAEVTFDALKKRYGDQPYFNEKIKLIGLRNKASFQGAIRNYELLTHMEKGAFVYHTAGWGTGEIMDFSLVREELAIEFESVEGLKYLAFENAFNHLVSLSKDHFLARRFGDPDSLEKEAKQDPAKVIRFLLRDLGPKTAPEIKEEMIGLIIPEKEWTKWWQGTRSKLKKDPLVKVPESIKDPFYLHSAEADPKKNYLLKLKSCTKPKDVFKKVYLIVRDQQELLQDTDIKEALLTHLNQEKEKCHNYAEQIQRQFLENIIENQTIGSNLTSLIEELRDWSFLEEIEIVAFKKQLISLIQQYRKDWKQVFFELLFQISQHHLRDFILKELLQTDYKEKIIDKFEELRQNPKSHPEIFFWYFNRLIQDTQHALPFSDKKGKHLFFEGLLTLLSSIELNPKYRELSKRIVSLITQNQFELLREMIKGASLEFIREVVLLATKSQNFDEHEIRTIHSLAAVAHPDFQKERKETPSMEDSHIIWTTERGYNTVQERIKEVSTKETVENAREIEAARALGDLRENAEYKASLEKRSRLQAELKMLSDQIHRARIISKELVVTDEVGIGTKVTLVKESGKEIEYTFLGPWDVNTEENILSIQSKFAKAFLGTKVGQVVEYNQEKYQVKRIKSYFE